MAIAGDRFSSLFLIGAVALISIFVGKVAEARAIRIDGYAQTSSGSGTKLLFDDSTNPLPNSTLGSYLTLTFSPGTTSAPYTFYDSLTPSACSAGSMFIWNDSYDPADSAVDQVVITTLLTPAPGSCGPSVANGNGFNISFNYTALTCNGENALFSVANGLFSISFGAASPCTAGTVVSGSGPPSYNYNSSGFGFNNTALGNLYLASSIPPGWTITSCSDPYLVFGCPSATGIITTFAGNGQVGFGGDGGAATATSLNYPKGIALDTLGDLLIADTDNNRVRKVTAAGVISTVAGNGSSGFSGDGGPATAATLSRPTAVAVDSSNNLYITDSNNQRIRMVRTSGVISTVAGDGIASYSGDGGQATAASLNNPAGIAVDAGGNLYVADSGNYRVRKINGNGIISTIAGVGVAGFSGDGGQAIAASLSAPAAVTLDILGNIYISDNERIRKIYSTGLIETIAGNGAPGYAGDGGSAKAASLNSPQGLAADSGGNLYIADFDNNVVREVSNAGVITTVGGTGTAGFGGDGGSSRNATFNFPSSVALAASGNIFIADQYNSRIRQVSGFAIPVPTLTATSATVFAGQNATISVSIPASPSTLAGPYTYQWYQVTSANTAVPIEGATGATFTTPSLNSTTSFWVQVISTYGFESSQTITITVSPGSGGSTQSTDGPVPPWALYVLGGALVSIASRRLTRAT